MEKANMDIRQYMEDHGVTQKMLGARLGFKEWKMSGIAQAVSFAARRMFESLDTKNQHPESRIYFKEERK